MPFFANASGFTIKDSHMYEFDGAYFNIHFAIPAESNERIARQLLGKRKERNFDNGDAEADGPRKRFREVQDETSDGLMIVHPKDIDLHRQLTSGSNYRTHSAFYGGRLVAVKVFDGPRAKQSWKLNLTLDKSFFHSNIPKIVGISGENISENPFIVFHGISDRKMNSLLAEALRTDLNRSVQLSMKSVKGLAAGLSYMESRNLLPKGIVSNLNWENFDIFAGGSDEPVLSIHLPDTTAHGPHSAPSFYHPEDYHNGIETLTRLCQKLFSEVNSILYDDSPERELYTDDSLETDSRVVQTNWEGHSNVPGAVSSSTEVQTSHKTPRREVRWKFDKSANNQRLDSIVRRFEDSLDFVSASSAGSPLRRIAASPHKLVSHRCPGYLREEITLTADVSRSVVVAHQYPSLNEICTICGQLVQYPSKRASIYCPDAPFKLNHFSSSDGNSLNGATFQPRSGSNTNNANAFLAHFTLPLPLPPIRSLSPGSANEWHYRRASSDSRSGRGAELWAGGGSGLSVSSYPSPNAGGQGQVVVRKPNVTTGRPANASHKRRKQATFVCPIPGCASTFSRSFNLKGHIRSHDEEKPFQCHWPGCGKGFAREHDCKRHEQLHTNYRPFTSDALNRYLRSEIGVECARLQETHMLVDECAHLQEAQMLVDEFP